MIGYVIGDTGIASLDNDSITVRLPPRQSASLTARIFNSGAISIVLNEESALCLSIVDDSREAHHTLKVGLTLKGGSRCALTSNFRGLCTGSEVSVIGRCGGGSVLALNQIFAGGSHTRGSTRVEFGQKCASQINVLTLPRDTAQEISVDVLHNGNGSRNTVLCSGIVPAASSVRFAGSLAVPPRKRDIESSLHGRFIAHPGSQVHALPVLNVHSRDVRTSHGASVANISPAALYYMGSRGIPESEARMLIERGEVESMLNRMSLAIANVLGKSKVMA